MHLSQKKVQFSTAKFLSNVQFSKAVIIKLDKTQRNESGVLPEINYIGKRQEVRSFGVSKNVLARIVNILSSCVGVCMCNVYSDS